MSNDTQAFTVNGRIIFGIMCTKQIKSMVHWSYDFKRISYNPSITGLTEVLFKKYLLTVRKRTDGHQQLIF